MRECLRLKVFGYACYKSGAQQVFGCDVIAVLVERTYLDEDVVVAFELDAQAVCEREDCVDVVACGAVLEQV